MIVKTTNEYDAEMVKRGCIHEVHTSERRSFRGCRRRWHWHFRDNYNPPFTPKPLEFGIAYHLAMQVLHRPETWAFQPDVQGALAEKAFVDECHRQQKEFLRARDLYALDSEAQDDYDDRVELGRGMLRYYVKTQLPKLKAEFTPTHVETSFDVLLLDEAGNTLYCRCVNCRRVFAKTGGGKWKGNPVVFSGRLDLIVHDNYGDYWIWDWKCHKVTHKVLTPTGWVAIGLLHPGDLVIGKNGKPTNVTFTSPVVQKPVYEVQLEDGTVIECSDDHVWAVYDRDNKLVDKTAKELSEAPAYQSYGLPVMNCVEFESAQNLVMDPYVLGSLLGDGYFGSSSLTYSSKSGETVQLLRTATDEVVDIKRYCGNNWGIVGPWKAQLKTLGLWGKLSGEKFIPQSYLFASVEDRIALLQGLYDTDGLVSQLCICTVSEQLAKDICHLVRSLGGKASMPSSTARTHSNGTTINVSEYFVNLWLPDTIQHCRLRTKMDAKRTKRGTHRRSIVAIRKTDRVAAMRCIAVDAPDCLYVIDNFVVTHNTAAALAQQEEFLELDDQVGGYVWALRVRLGLAVRGFIYFEIRKAFPSPPLENKTRRLGRLYSVNKNQSTDYETYRAHVAEHDKTAYEEGCYDDFLNALKAQEGQPGGGFFRKFTIYKTDYELDQIGKNLLLETLDMIDPKTRIYPASGRFACQSCAFRVPCISKNSGQDYEYTLQTLYEVKPPYYLRQRLSTEKRGGE